MARRLGTAALLALLIACGGGDGRGTPPPPPPPDGGVDAAPAMCTSSAECDDGVECTVDGCGVDGTCTATPIDSRCGAGEVCEVGTGCRAPAECAGSADCDDAVACTLDMCAFGGVCEHVPVDDLCDASQTCTAAGCVGPESCSMASDCDDLVDCTVDGCGVDGTCTATPVDARCADGERCAPGVGCTKPCATDDECQDDSFCNGREICMPEFGCAPAPGPRACDDSDPCTLDACDPGSDMCVFVCDRSMTSCGCPAPMGRDGVYSLSPAPSQTCAIDGMGGFQVDYMLSTVEFAFLPTLLSVRAGLPKATSSNTLTQMPAPTGDDFDVSTIVGGGCEEHYRLVGSFTGPETFEATFSLALVDTSPPIGCFFLTAPCMNQSVAVTGTRISGP